MRHLDDDHDDDYGDDDLGHDARSGVLKITATSVMSPATVALPPHPSMQSWSSMRRGPRPREINTHLHRSEGTRSCINIETLGSGGTGPQRLLT